MDLGLQDKVVLLIGGNGGIGAPAAKMFAAEGARVALTFHRNREAAEKVAADIEETRGRALVLPYDLTNLTSIRLGVTQLVGAWGGVDVVVTSASPAGVPGRHGRRFETVAAATWQAELDEVTGVLHTVQAVLPVMKRRPDGGRIVLLSSNRVRQDVPGNEGYVAAKSALHGLSRALATELVEHRILCNVVAPGPTVTDRLLREHLPDGVALKVQGLNEEQTRRVLDRELPHLRFSTPEEVAKAVVFLGSWANGNVTGDVLYVSGGR